MSSTGYIQFPNFVFDNIMPELSHSGWKLFCFVWRKTAGWNKTSDHISYSQIAEGTGIKGRATIAKAIDEVSLFVRVNSKTGRGNSCEFDITEVLNSSEIELNSSNNERFSDVKSSEIDIKSSVFDVKSSEIEHTIIHYTKDTNTKDIKDAKKPAPKKSPAKKPMPETIPAFKVYVEVTGQYYLSKPQQKIIGDAVGTDPPALKKWRDVVTAWVGKSYNPRNVTGMLDWFKGEIPQYNGGTNGHQQSKQSANGYSGAGQNRKTRHTGKTPEQLAEDATRAEFAKLGVPWPGG